MNKIWLLLTVLLLSACTIYGRYPANPIIQNYAILETEGMTISQTDGSWYMLYGKKTAVPPKVLALPAVVKFRQHDSGIESIEGGGPLVHELAVGRQALLAKPGYSEQVMNVTVQLDGESDVLYGQMLFIAARSDMPTSKATTFWSVKLPQHIIGKAKSGREAMIYQSGAINTVYGTSADAVTMVMWLSSQPF